MSVIQSIDYAAIAPVLSVAIAAVAVLVVDLFVTSRRAEIAAGLSFAGLAVGIGWAAWLTAGSSRSTFCLPGGGCSYVTDDYTLFFQLLFLVTLLVVLLLSRSTVVADSLPAGEFHFLLLSSGVGMLTLAAARDLITLLIALEVVSLPAFILVGLRRSDPRGIEAALKFFLFSVVATGLTVYGMALLYGVTGTVQVDGIGAALASVHSGGGAKASLAATAVVLVIAGFAFKIAAVPFHFWAPDTYQGAPVPVAAFLSTASKAAGFAGLLVLLLDAFVRYADVWGPVIAVIAAVTMTVGNVVALRQWHLVRLLAWSAVAQAGWMLMPLGVAATSGGRTPTELRAAGEATLVYLGIYLAMNLGAFACAVLVTRARPQGAIEDLRGLVRRAPLTAVAFALFLTALAGLPPGVAGLFAKVAVLREAVHGHVVWLAVVAVVNAVIGLAYYLRVAGLLFSSRESGSPEDAGLPSLAARATPLVSAGLAVALAATVALSVYPQPLFHWARNAAKATNAARP